MVSLHVELFDVMQSVVSRMYVNYHFDISSAYMVDFFDKLNKETPQTELQGNFD